MAKRPPTIPDSELDVLKVLWDRGRMTVRDMHQHLAAQEGNLAYTTVLSLLQMMEQKALVGRELTGKAHVYFAKVPREGTLRSLAGGFLDGVFDGAMNEYVVRALEAKAPTVAELEELEQMIAQAKRQVQGVRPGEVTR